MNSPLEPYGDNVVLQPEKAQEKTASGILLATSAQEKPKSAIVVAVGPEVKHVRVSDRVLYKDAYDNDSFKSGNDEFVVTKEENIRGKLK